MNEDNPWKTVLCTHEEAQGLSTGDWLGDKFPGVALPSVNAKGLWIEIVFNGKWTPARVMDVGPWCEDDDEYVFYNERPRAERFKDQLVAINKEGRMQDRPSNGSGIDLFPQTAKALGIKLGENVTLKWKFIEPKT